MKSQGELVGRELDAAVHRDVMGATWPDSRCRICGWVIVGVDPKYGCVIGNCSMRPVPDRRADESPLYSTSIATAMQALDRFAEWTLFKTEIDDPMVYDVEITQDSRVFTGTASTLPEAICRAALATINTGETDGK